MRVLSLFSGGGLGDYGLELAGMEIVGQVEIDDYCQKILKLRWPHVARFIDIKDFDGTSWRGRVDLISGGFPCQDISSAGKGAGIGGERSGLWKEMYRIICEIRPRYVLVENVSALLGRGLGVVLGDLAEIGYDAEWDCIPASALGAPHQRDRVWIVGILSDAKCGGCKPDRKRGRLASMEGRGSDDTMSTTESSSLADTSRELRNGRREKRNRRTESSNGGEISHTKGKTFMRRNWIFQPSPEIERRWKNNGGGTLGDGRWWAVEPNVGRVAHGVAKRVDRLKLLGNGQVCQVVEWIGHQIIEFDKTRLECDKIKS